MEIFWILSGHVDIRYVIPFQGLLKTATAPFHVFTVFKGKDKERARFIYIYAHTRLMSIFKGKDKKKYKGYRLRWWWWWRRRQETRKPESARCNRNGNHPLLQKAAAATTKPRNQKKTQPKEIPRQSIKDITSRSKKSPHSIPFFSIQIFISITKRVIFFQTSLNWRLGRSCHSCSVLIVAKL